MRAIVDRPGWAPDLARKLTALDPYVSGRDGDVLSSAFATRSDVPAVERDRVDIEFDEESDEPPVQIALDPDDGHAAAVGRTGDGRQYFLTAPALAEDDTSYLALYLFDLDGQLVEEDIRRLEEGEDDGDVEAELLGRLPARTVERIVVAPFAVDRFDETFGLVATERFGEWRVIAMPGDYMEFCPPWDSGIYDT